MKESISNLCVGFVAVAMLTSVIYVVGDRKPTAMTNDQKGLAKNIKVSAENLRDIVLYSPIFSSERVLEVRNKEEHRVLGGLLYNVVARYQWLTGVSLPVGTLSPVYRDRYEAFSGLPFYMAGYWDFEYPIVDNVYEAISKHPPPFSCQELLSLPQCDNVNHSNAFKQVEYDAYLLARATHIDALDTNYYQEALKRAYAIQK